MQFTVIVAALLSAAAVQGRVLERRDCPAPVFACGATSSQNYIVQSGDTLTKIAHDVYHRVVGICDIAAANNITNPNLIYADQTLVIPINCQTIDDSSCL